jgi:hypothetical protein
MRFNTEATEATKVTKDHGERRMKKNLIAAMLLPPSLRPLSNLSVLCVESPSV